MEEIISDDLLLARGLAPRTIALICYALTGVLVVTASLAKRAGFLVSLLLLGLSVGALLIGGVRLGIMRAGGGRSEAEQAQT